MESTLTHLILKRSQKTSASLKLKGKETEAIVGLGEASLDWGLRLALDPETPTGVRDRYAEAAIDQVDGVEVWKPEAVTLSCRPVLVKLQQEPLSIVWSMPILLKIRELFPACPIHVLAKPEFHEYLKLIPGLTPIRGLESGYESGYYREFDFRVHQKHAVNLTPMTLAFKPWYWLAEQRSGLSDIGDNDSKPKAISEKTSNDGVLLVVDRNFDEEFVEKLIDLIGTVTVLDASCSLFEGHVAGQSHKFVIGIGLLSVAAAAVMAAGGPGYLMIPNTSSGEIYAAQCAGYAGIEYAHLEDARVAGPAAVLDDILTTKG